MEAILLPIIGFIVLMVVAAVRYFQTAHHGSTKTNNNEHRVFFSQVHGIKHKNADRSSRQEIIRRCREGEELLLIPEPTNPHDAGAVKICRKNGEQLGYWEGDGRIANDLAKGWTYRVTIEEIYAFEHGSKQHGVKLRVEVLTMSRRTEERKSRQRAAR